MTSVQNRAADLPIVVAKLLAYCESNNWAGHDPYDALNSRLLQSLPILDSRLPRLVMTQLLKRSPVDVRPLLQVPKTQNPKALALFVSALLQLPDRNTMHAKGRIQGLLETLVALRSPDCSSWCWGYSFPWQTRTQLVPRANPNLVCTTFVASTLLDVYEWCGDTLYLEMAASSAEYIVRDLFWSESGVCGFAYPLPSMRQSVHNANFLAAALLCRVAKHTGDSGLIEPALKAARYSASRQREDGSWLYGEMPKQGWVDNFHTGYNLCALRSLSQDLRTSEFESNILRGYRFYDRHFVRDDGAPRYFHDNTYPIDIHCAAQSILTYLAFRDQDLGALSKAQSVYRWTVEHMWDDTRGYFYYRRLRLATIRTSYMRWSQAWMLLAVNTLYRETVAPQKDLALEVLRNELRGQR